MKILVITDLYPIKEEEKHTPKTIYDFVQSWKDLGHEVKIIKPNFLLNSFIRKKPFYKAGLYGDTENVNYWLPFVFNLKKKIRTDLNSDIVIAHMPSGLITANKLGLKFNAAVHTSDLEVLTNPLYSIYFKNQLENAYGNAVKIGCRSDAIKKKFLALYPEFEQKTFVAYSGIDENIITKRNWTKKSKYSVITCAHLIKRKNVDKVIHACKEINNIELTVIGEGKELSDLKKISNKVIFTGQIPHEKVIEKMKESDIFVLPSEKETFGMVYLEAMASGCITVGLENDGIDGIIRNGVNGYLCRTDNVKETLENIITSDIQNTILENSFETIKEYTKKNAAENYLKNIISEG